MTRRSAPPRRRSVTTPLVLAVGWGTALVLLSVLVASGATQHLDDEVRELFRPDDVWGTAQLRADVVVEGLRPTRALPAVLVIAAATALATRSWCPVVLAVGLLGTTVALTLGLKELIGHPDPHGEVPDFGGSFPSGHVASVVVGGGLVVLVLGLGSRWWAWSVVALVALAMATALLLQAAHWGTDVLGGALVGAFTVTAGVAVARGSARTARHRRAAGSTSANSPRSCPASESR